MAVVMEEMLKELRNPEKIMRREMEQMQREKQKLLEANLHYCRMLAEE